MLQMENPEEKNNSEDDEDEGLDSKHSYVEQWDVVVNSVRSEEPHLLDNTDIGILDSYRSFDGKHFSLATKAYR
jgi:hypothetical protein